jgi:hypothetical protein
VSGNIDCWGLNDIGELGNGTRTNSSYPVAVSGLTGDTAIASESSSSHTCAIVTGGATWCWGDGATTPVQVVFP